jgi:hypothetical protein
MAYLVEANKDVRQLHFLSLEKLRYRLNVFKTGNGAYRSFFSAWNS